MSPRPVGKNAIIFVMITVLLDVITFGLIIPVLPALLVELTGDPVAKVAIYGGWLSFMYAFMQFVCAPLLGNLSDRFGRRPVLFFALGAYVLTALACAAAWSFDALLGMRAAMGLLAAGLGVLPGAIIRDRYEGDAMARLMSTIFIVFMVVPVLAPSVGQAVLEVAPWRWVFATIAALGGAVMTWAWLRLPETLAHADRQPLDLRSVAHNLPLTFTTRSAVGYVIGAGLTFGAMFGYTVMSRMSLLIGRVDFIFRDWLGLIQ